MTIKWVFSIGLAAVSFLCQSQNKLDSLETLLNSQKDELKRVGILYNLAYEYADVDNSRALKFGMKGFLLAKELSDSIGIIRTGRITAYILRKLNNLDSAIIIGMEIISLAETQRNIQESIRIINGLAWALTGKAQYAKALHYYLRNLELVRIVNDTRYEAVTLNNIGLVYFKLTDYDKSLDYYFKCLELHAKEKDSLDIDRLLINIGDCYAGKRDFKEAQRYVLKGLGVCAEGCSNEIIAEAYFVLGYVSYQLGNAHDGEKYFTKSYKAAKQINFVRFVFDNVDYLTEIYLNQNRLKEAKRYLDECETILVRYGSQFPRETNRLYLRYSHLYEKIGDHKKASFYQKKYIQLRDSIYGGRWTLNLMKIEADYLERENKSKIASQEQILILQQEAIKRQKLLNISVSVIAVILVVLAVVLFRSNRQKKMINRLLDLKVRERTKELELNRNELLKACDERDLILERTARQIRSSIASMKGIYEVGRKDITDSNALRYINEVEETSKTLANTLLSLQHVQRKTSE